MMRLLLPVILLAMGCGSVRTDPPPVQPSAAASATAVVTVSQGGAFSPSCLVVNPGAIVEWRNLTPQSPVDVVSAAAPFEISSPTLLAPYDEVPAAQSSQCARYEPDGVTCADRLAYTYWRHSFGLPGVFDYVDSIGAASPTAATMPVGTVCVVTSDHCDQICCVPVIQCPAGLICAVDSCGVVAPPQL